VALANVPDDIRGFGHVKENNLKAARGRWEKLLAQFRNPQAAGSLIAAKQNGGAGVNPRRFYLGRVRRAEVSAPALHWQADTRPTFPCKSAPTTRPTKPMSSPCGKPAG
jgi:hypothetical protein